MINFTLIHPRMTREALGEIPYFLSEEDPRSAAEQINANYPFGGWQKFRGFTKADDKGGLKYPGDPVMRPLASAKLRDETIYFYQSAWVGIFQPDGSFEIARLD
jgi:hypothetical protein